MSNYTKLAIILLMSGTCCSKSPNPMRPSKHDEFRIKAIRAVYNNVITAPSRTTPSWRLKDENRDYVVVSTGSGTWVFESPTTLVHTNRGDKYREFLIVVRSDGSMVFVTVDQWSDLF